MFGTPRLIPLQKKTKRKLLLLHIKAKNTGDHLKFIYLGDSFPFVALE